ncbi:MAG: hypothetical protein IPG46_01875 [Actinobacteria bacterium]|nr:hypothetical protein [Actinomycetota bacterium]
MGSRRPRLPRAVGVGVALELATFASLGAAAARRLDQARNFPKTRGDRR